MSGLGNKGLNVNVRSFENQTNRVTDIEGRINRITHDSSGKFKSLVPRTKDSSSVPVPNGQSLSAPTTHSPRTLVQRQTPVTSGSVDGGSAPNTTQHHTGQTNHTAQVQNQPPGQTQTQTQTQTQVQSPAPTQVQSPAPTQVQSPAQTQPLVLSQNQGAQKVRRPENSKEAESARQKLDGMNVRLVSILCDLGPEKLAETYKYISMQNMCLSDLRAHVENLPIPKDPPDTYPKDAKKPFAEYAQKRKEKIINALKGHEQSGQNMKNVLGSILHAGKSEPALAVMREARSVASLGGEKEDSRLALNKSLESILKVVQFDGKSHAMLVKQLSWNNDFILGGAYKARDGENSLSEQQYVGVNIFLHETSNMGKHDYSNSISLANHLKDALKMNDKAKTSIKSSNHSGCLKELKQALPDIRELLLKPPAAFYVDKHAQAQAKDAHELLEKVYQAAGKNTDDNFNQVYKAVANLYSLSSSVDNLFNPKHVLKIPTHYSTSLFDM